MEKILVIFTDTIDELEINGFKIMRSDDYDELEKLAQKITWPFTYNIGDFEIEFNTGEDFLYRLEVKDISFEDEKALKRLFGTNNQFGVFIDTDFLREVIGEEDEYDYDDDEEDYDDDDIDNLYDDYDEEDRY